MTLLLPLWLGAGPGRAQDTSYGAELAVASQYAWRGIVVSDEVGIQPCVWAGAGGWETSLWSNISPQDPDAGVVDELDLFLTYTREVGPVELVPGVGAYYIPGEPEYSTVELTLDAVAAAGPVRFGFEQSVDAVVARWAWWGRPTVGVEVEPTESLWLSGRLGPSLAAASWNEEMAGVGAVGGLDTLHADGEVGYALGDSWSVAARAELDWWLLDPRPGDAWVPMVVGVLGWEAAGE